MDFFTNNSFGIKLFKHKKQTFGDNSSPSTSGTSSKDNTSNSYNYISSDNIYNYYDKEDGYNNCDEYSILNLLSTILIAVAVYLAVKCKKDGNDNMIQIMIAIFFAPFYIIYRLIYPCF